MTPNHFECQIPMNPPEIDSEINDLLRAISDIDSKHESDLDRIEKAVINRDLRLYLARLWPFWRVNWEREAAKRTMR
jgi:hypothetical protein